MAFTMVESAETPGKLQPLVVCDVCSGPVRTDGYVLIGSPLGDAARVTSTDTGVTTIRAACSEGCRDRAIAATGRDEIAGYARLSEYMSALVSMTGGIPVTRLATPAPEPDATA